jgi:hypothetical protein
MKKDGASGQGASQRIASSNYGSFGSAEERLNRLSTLTIQLFSEIQRSGGSVRKQGPGNDRPVPTLTCLEEAQRLAGVNTTGRITTREGKSPVTFALQHGWLAVARELADHGLNYDGDKIEALPVSGPEQPSKYDQANQERPAARIGL